MKTETTKKIEQEEKKFELLLTATGNVELIEAYIDLKTSLVERAVEFSESKQMKWIKANEVPFPEVKNHQRLSIKYKGRPDTLQFVNGLWYWWADGLDKNDIVAKESLSAIEWLDESAPQPTQQGCEEFAVNFGTWYSGMERPKVVAAFQRYQREVLEPESPSPQKTQTK